MADIVVIVDTGLAITTLAVKSAGAAEPHHIGWGTDDDPTPLPAQTTLNAESAEGRVTGASTQETEDATNDVYQVVGTITSASAQGIVEAGLFDSVAGGTDIMYLRATFSVINVGIGGSIQFTIRSQYDQG